MLISAHCASWRLGHDEAEVVGTCYLDGAGTYAVLVSFEAQMADHVWLCERDARDEFPHIYCQAANGDITILPSTAIATAIYKVIDGGVA